MRITDLKTIAESLKLYLLDTGNSKSLFLNDTFEAGDEGWQIETGQFHHVTIDTNTDASTGLEGDILVNAYGSYYGGTAYKEVEIVQYSEVVFEWYMQNDNPELQDNEFVFYVDGVEKARLVRATPWERIKPVGLAPGKHTLSFTYNAGAIPNGKKGVFNHFQIWKSERIICKVRDYKPPVTESQLSESKTIRGYTRFQEMTEADTILSFQMIINAEYFQNFQRNMRKIFYFVDEFGIAYRGVFRNITSDKIALGSVYSFDLDFISDSKVGYGFC